MRCRVVRWVVAGHPFPRTRGHLSRDTLGKVSEIVNAMGESSAAAQGLSKPITTAERLRNSEHKLYFLIDQAANNGKGAVTGMLKTGKKGLYVFDKQGQHYQVSPPCILDFYVHESRQRTGLGKHLFEHMLKKEQIEPVNMAIDRPSEKLLGFLNKHYTLNSPVKQMNNFVVFDGFFPKTPEKNNVEPDNSCTVGKKESANGLQSFSSPYGRYGAPRPPCSMGQIIHNQTSTINKSQEPTGVQSMPATNYQSMQYRSPNTIPNVAQSTPNVNYGGPILNTALNQNTTAYEALNAQYQNQVNQLNRYNMQNTQRNMTVNSSGDNERHNQIYQQYQNTIQPAVTNASQPQLANQYLAQNASHANYNNPQNLSNNQYSTENSNKQMQHPNAQNIPSGGHEQVIKTNQTMNQGDVNQPILYQQNTQPNQNYHQEQLYQKKVDLQPAHTTQQWQNPNTVSHTQASLTQPHLQSPNYVANQQQISEQQIIQQSNQEQMNQQHINQQQINQQQMNQQQMNQQPMNQQQMNQQHINQQQINQQPFNQQQTNQQPNQQQQINQQNYPNLEQRFENININDQLHQRITPTNYPVSAAVPSGNVTNMNAKMVSEMQEMYQSPKVTQPQASYNQLQGNNSGDYSINPQNNASNTQTQWTHQNVQTPQHEAYNMTNPNTFTSNTFAHNLQHTGDMTHPEAQNVTATKNMQITYSAPQMQNPRLQTPQAAAVNNPSYQNTGSPSMQYNEIIPPAQQNSNVRRFTSNPGLQSPHVNVNQQYSASVQHIPQQHISPTYQSYEMNNPAQQMAPHAISNNPSTQFSGPQIIDSAQAGQLMENTNIPTTQQTYSARNLSTTYNQSYNAPNQNMAPQQPVYHAGDQIQKNVPPVQTYSVRNVPGTPNMHPSRQDIPHDSYSALNIPRYNNMPTQNHIYTDIQNSKNQGHITNGLVENAIKQNQERVVENKTGKEEIKKIREEDNLIYGYPPQYTKSQVMTKTNAVSIRQT